MGDIQRKDEIVVNDKSFYLMLVNPNEDCHFNFSYLLCIPKKDINHQRIVMQTNSSENTSNLVLSSYEEIKNCIYTFSNCGCPIMMPILPIVEEGIPYFQQLSIECFDRMLNDTYSRIDLQVIDMLEDAKVIINNITKSIIDEQIFISGYLSSAVFAQRFALIHPELVVGICVGGAISSIPMPFPMYNGNELRYPIGTFDISKLLGVDFNEDAYRKIKFTYYFSEFELENSRNLDISYQAKSIKDDTGKVLRSSFGENVYERAQTQLTTYRRLGYDLSVTIMPSLNQKNITDSKDIVVPLITDAYHSTLDDYKNNLTQ